MSPVWTDEQKQLRRSFEPYFERLSAGHVDDDVNGVFNREKWDLLRESGAIRIPFLPENGGMGHDALTLVYALEHLGYGCRDSGLLFGLATQIVSQAIPIERFGSDYLKEKYLRKLIDGELISAHAISEPEAGSDATAMKTTVVEDGDEFVINGRKAYCTSGPIADNITVYATEDPEKGAQGINAFVVERSNPGMKVSDPIPKMGLGTSPIGSIEFNDCRVPKENLIGKRGGGFFILEHVMTWEILCIFIMMVGEMQNRLERTVKFAKRRKQFGAPIGSFQLVQEKIVEMKIGVENSRFHLYATAEKVARKRSVITEIAMAKLVTSEANVQSAMHAVQIHGGAGFMRETGLETELRAAIGAPIYSGSNEMQKIRIASMMGLMKSAWKSF